MFFTKSNLFCICYKLYAINYILYTINYTIAFSSADNDNTFLLK